MYKLTEKEFVPLLVQLLEWSAGSLEKSISFYNLAAQLSDKLQVCQFVHFSVHQQYSIFIAPFSVIASFFYILLLPRLNYLPSFARSAFGGMGVKFKTFLTAALFCAKTKNEGYWLGMKKKLSFHELKLELGRLIFFFLADDIFRKQI